MVAGPCPPLLLAVGGQLPSVVAFMDGCAARTRTKNTSHGNDLPILCAGFPFFPRGEDESGLSTLKVLLQHSAVRSSS